MELQTERSTDTMSGRGAGAAGDAVVGPGGEHNDNGAGHVGDGAGQGGDEDGQMDLDGLRVLMEARLDDFDTRLAQQADMLVQLQGMLQDGLLGGAAGPGGPIGGGQEPGALQGGAVPQAFAGPAAHASKLAAKTRLNMWLNTTTRKYWILVDARPALTSIRRTELQDLLQKRVMVTGEIATQLETLSGFDVTGYMPRTATAKSVAESRFPLADQLAILAHAVSTVVGYGEHTENTTARIRTLDAAFARGIEVVREHALDFFEAMNVPANRSRLAKLINADLAAWSSKLVRAGEEHAIFLSETPESSRAHLCCADYSNGPSVKRALERALGGKELGASVQDGPARGLVVTLSPGSLSGSAADEERGERKLAARAGDGVAVRPLEARWRSFWDGARGRSGAQDLAEVVPWTSGSSSVALDASGVSRGRGEGRRRSLVAEEGGARLGPVSRAREYHGGKAKGYVSALEHLGGRMEEEGGRALSEACGWDRNLEFVHAGDDLVYLKGAHHLEHDEATGMACFVGLIGFLSAQPEVMHIHPDARAEATNKVVSAYIEGGEPTETPMREAGLNGAGQIIGISDTGLDESSCFFRDDVNGLVPRTSMSDGDAYPDQRKVIQYVVFGDDDTDADGHGTHVSGIALGKITSGWEEPWESQVSQAECEEEGLVRSCLGDCVEEMTGTTCHWNMELACPMSGCDEDISCDADTGYEFPCFEDPEDELPEASGVAPDSKLAFFDLGNSDDTLSIPDDIGDMWDAQYAAGARIMSNSWSLVTLSEPTARDVQLDEWIRNNPEAFVVFGAGNNGFVDSSFNPGSVQSPATAKTAMTVGASNSGPDRAYAYYSSSSSNYDGVLWPGSDVSFEVSPYSARGPVGRFTTKPDVVAPGLMVHSAKASRSEDSSLETCALDSLGGTSMSAPAVAGAAALVRQFFGEGMLASYLEAEGLCAREIYVEAGLCEAFDPPGYLVKAILINSAEWLGEMQTVSYGEDVEWMTVLDFAQGFGAVQLATGIPTSSAPKGVFYHDGSLGSDEHMYYSVYVGDASEDLSVTLAWYDPPATVSSYNLLHDLDVYVMSVDTGHYFHSNSHNTMQSLCNDEELCAQKYEFSFNDSLADFINPVERVSIPSTDLEEGYYVVEVQAHTLTESDSQAYGVAAAGGGVVLVDMASLYEDLGFASEGGEHLIPAASSESSSPSFSPASASASPTSMPSPVVEDGNFILAPPGTPVPTADPSGGAPERMMTRQGARGGGGDAGGSGDGGGIGGVAAGGGGGSGLATESKVAVGLSAVAAFVLIGVGVVLAVRRRKVRGAAAAGGAGESGGTGDEMYWGGGKSSSLRVVHAANDESKHSEGGGFGSYEEDNGLPSSPAEHPHLPGYATAVATAPPNEDEDSAIVPGGGGVSHGVNSGVGGEEGIELISPADECEASGFYAAVDPAAVSKLVGWGISCDFARVALRRTDNDIPGALRLIAEGSMDSHLAADQEEIALEQAAEAEAEAEAKAEAATEASAAPTGPTAPLSSVDGPVQ
eukprot:jgi/Undpi1/6606/HiC_scaffold_20.g09085.m1